MALSEYKDKLVSIITNDGRNIIGTLRGFDQTINVVLEKTHERIYSADQGVVMNDLGLYIVRGDTIAMLGELDSEIDDQQDLNTVKAEPLKPVRWE